MSTRFILVTAASMFFMCGFAAAKKSKQLNDGPFHKADVFSQVSRTELKTAEISAYDAENKHLFVVGDENTMEVVNLTDPSKPVVERSFSLDGVATSVTMNGNLLAVSLLSNPAWQDGYVEFIQYNSKDAQNPLVKKGVYQVCSHPDMVTFTPDGKKVLVACEGEVEDGHDPLGGVAIISIDSAAMDESLGLKPIIRIIPFEDPSIEPEYITVSKDSKYAWVSLQENNAMARINVEKNSLDTIFDLGVVDHSKAGFAIDMFKDGKIRSENSFVVGLRQPDGISSFELDGKYYVVTANEGAEIENFDKKKVCGNKEMCEVLFGTRSISIFDGLSGALIWDCGESLEKTIAEVAPSYFNWNSKKGKKKVDARSNRKGSEPENVTVADVNGKKIAFVGLERMSGVAVFDITDIKSPRLLDYYMDPKDRGPEGMLFLDAQRSPIPGTPVLIVCYEYSKTLAIYKVKL